MKVGDLVKLNKDAPDAPGINSRPPSEFGRIGIITEWKAHEDGPLLSGWVRWGGNVDWDIEYAEDLEVVSAHKR